MGLPKRPFWMHQLVEYVLGAVLVASGLQSPTPAVPAVVGGVVMLHAALTSGPLAAFRVVGRQVHRVVDVGVIALELVAAVQPWIAVEGGTRVIVGGIAAVHAFVWWQSSYATKPPRSAARAAVDPDADRSTEIGRTAGRAVGQGVNAVKRMAAKRSGD
jgi:hypothetical protein